MFCEECKEFYCTSCGRKHKTYRICQPHNVVQLEVSETMHLKTTMESLSIERVDSDDCYEKVGRNISSNIISKPGNYESLYLFSKKEEENTYEALSQEENAKEAVDQEENSKEALESTGENVQKEKSSAGHSGTQNIFPVDLIQSPPNSRLRIPHGSYHLQLQQNGIRLSDKKTDCQISYWPYNGIRRFRSQRKRYVIIAGRACESGEGEFVFSTSLGSEIHKTCISIIKIKVDSKTK